MRMSLGRVVVLVALALLAAPMMAWAAEEDSTVFVQQPPNRGKALAVEHSRPGPVIIPAPPKDKEPIMTMGASAPGEGSGLRSGSLGGILGGSFGASSSRDGAARRLRKTIRDLG